VCSRRQINNYSVSCVSSDLISLSSVDRTRDEKVNSKRQLAQQLAGSIVWGVYVKRIRDRQNGNIHMACVREIML